MIRFQQKNFGKTDGEINSIIGPAYNTFKRYFSDACIALSECSGDMAVVPTRKGGDWYDGGQYRELHMHAWTANTSAVKTHGQDLRKRSLLVT